MRSSQLSRYIIDLQGVWTNDRCRRSGEPCKIKLPVKILPRPGLWAPRPFKAVERQTLCIYTVKPHASGSSGKPPAPLGLPLANKVVSLTTWKYVEAETALEHYVYCLIIIDLALLAEDL